MTPAATPPFSIAGIDHIVLRARDCRRLVAFYRDVIGCPVEREQPEIGLIQLRAGRSLIDVLETKARGAVEPSEALANDGRNVDHFCLTIDPFDPERLRAYLISRGVAAGEVAMRYGAEGEGLSLYFQDPEGNGVELKAARTPK
ncbi:MAG TPA: VOC family protein [Steroidobacteraceae bacterium]|jgi:catechol-2,3-dioxygenase|nr:VOC family protein [Steroidobacteraceae bacterium]